MTIILIFLWLIICLIKKIKNNKINNNMTDKFVYIINHHYYCDDYYYPPYCDLYRIYQTDKEAYQTIYDWFKIDNEEVHHFKVMKYRINKKNEPSPFSEVLYDSYKHIINENLEIIERENEKEENHPQIRRIQ
jgi:hypothetical protein